MSGFLDPKRYPHGTRARYVAAKCRCALCKCANTAYYHERRRRALAAAAEVQPSRRKTCQWTFFMRSRPDGSAYSVTAAMCPGVGGRPCVQGGVWLRNYKRVCALCVERATVWNGLVSARRARKHVLALRAKGIGRDAIAAACDVAVTVIADVASGAKKRIRAQTEKRLLSVDEGARADGAKVPAARTYELLGDLFARGFTARWVSRELGYVGSYRHPLQCRRRGFVTARNAADVEKLHRRVLEQGIEPQRDRIDATPTHKRIDRLLREGFSLKRLSREIGVFLRPVSNRRGLVRRSTAAKVEQFYREVFDEGARVARYEPLDIADFATARSA